MGVVANLVVKVTASVSDFNKQIAGLEKEADRLGANMKSVGSKLTAGITLPLVALGGGALKAAADFEEAFAGVAKTVDGVANSKGELTAFGKELQQAFRNLAKEIPVSVNELAKIGETAGAMGIPKAKILDFTEVMAKLGATTDLTSDQAASSIGKIQNVYQAAGVETDRFASALVALGNAGASTESQILNFAERMGGAAVQAKISQAEVLGWSNAMASVGLNAELGSTAWNKVVSLIGKAVDLGGPKLEQFAKVSGMTGQAFAQLFRQDASEAVNRLVEGFGRVGASGGNLTKVMEDMGLKTSGIQMTFKNLASSGDMVRQSLDMGKKAWQENIAMEEEFTKKSATFISQLKVLFNQLYDAAITLGNALKPTFLLIVDWAKGFVSTLATVAEGFAKLPAGVQMFVIALGGIAAAAGPALYIAGTLVQSWGAVAGALGLAGKAIVATGTAATTAAAGVTALQVALLGIAALGVITVGVAVVYAESKHLQNLKNARAEDLIMTPEGDLRTRREMGLGPGREDYASQMSALNAYLNPEDYESQLKALYATYEKKPGAAGGQPLFGGGGEDEKYLKAVAEMAEKIGGSGAAKELKILEAAFLSLTPAQRANAAVVKEVLDKYDDLRIAAGMTTPALEQLLRTTGTLTNQLPKGFYESGMGMGRGMQQFADRTREATMALQGRNPDGTLMTTGFGQDMPLGVYGATWNKVEDNRASQLRGPLTQMEAAVLDFTVGMRDQVTGTFTDILTGARGFKDGFLDIWQSIKNGLRNIFQSFLDQIIGGFVQKTVGGLLGKLGGGFGGLLGGMGGMGGGAASAGMGGMGAGMGAFMTNPWTLAAIGGIALGTAVWKKGLFRGGEEALQVNPARDEFLAKFGDPSQKGIGGGGYNLAAKLTELTGEEGGGYLFRMLQQADTMKEFNAAVKLIEEKLAVSAEAAKQQNTVEQTQTEKVVASLNLIVMKLDELIARMLGGTATAAIGGATPAQIDAAAQSSPVSADVWNPRAPHINPDTGEYETREPVLRDDTGTPVTVNINAGTIIGNPDELAQMVWDATADGGEAFNTARILTNQMVGAT